MKLIIQIPCFNEEDTLKSTLDDLPQEIAGIDEIEVLVINDGSTDNTTGVATQWGVHHILNIPHNKGLANAFKSGIQECISLGADIIVNTDADNQYCAKDIEKLVEPIINGRAECAIGCRPIETIEHFSAPKRIFQLIGSAVVRIISGTDVKDAPSGFRAFSRSFAKTIKVYGNYTYTLETIIQAGRNDRRIESVPIRVNGPTRPSRLFRSAYSYVFKSASTIVRVFVLYKPFRFFLFTSSIFFLISTIGFVRFFYFYLTGDGDGHIQSLIFSSMLFVGAIQTLMAAFIADIISVNRRLLEELSSKVNREK